LEPAPQWTARKQPFPWLEIGWAFAAALILAVYWTELRFGYFSLHAVVDHILDRVPLKYICVGAALAMIGLGWVAPKVARELN